MHGNEPAGIRALHRVLGKIEDGMVSLRGELIGLAGNLPAIAVGKRYLAHDLNRRWIPERVGALDRGRLSDEDSEDQEQRALLVELRQWMGRARGDIFVIDLHTTSAPTVPFVILGDTLRNREFARGLPTSIVIGVDEQLVGTLSDYVTSLGHVSIGFEAGQHQDPASVDYHEAAIWLMLVRSGALDRADVPDLDRFREMLEEFRKSLPPVMEIFDCHGVSRGDGFVMRPGFRNFQKVTRGEHLADDRSGEIRAPGNHRLFLPLYQGLGDEGFFLARPVNPLWLIISSWLRSTRLPAIAPRLPGVRRHPESQDRLVVNRRVARLLPREFFHLLGFRVRTEDRDHLVVAHREGGSPEE
jgi:succinylglutamate desuccinylase